MFFCSVVDEYLDYFHFLTIVNSAAMNIIIQLFTRLFKNKNCRAVGRVRKTEIEYEYVGLWDTVRNLGARDTQFVKLSI